MKLPGWFRAATFTVADGVRDLRLSADRQTLHLLAWTTSMPDDGDMLTTWQHRSVDLQTGLVDVARYGREPEQTKERGSAVREFWQRVEAQTGGAPLQPVPPSPLAWRFQDPNQSDTEKPKGGPFLDGLLIARNEELRGARVSVLRVRRLWDRARAWRCGWGPGGMTTRCWCWQAGCGHLCWWWTPRRAPSSCTPAFEAMGGGGFCALPLATRAR